jgi:hypothetical protein
MYGVIIRGLVCKAIIQLLNHFLVTGAQFPAGVDRGLLTRRLRRAAIKRMKQAVWDGMLRHIFPVTTAATSSLAPSMGAGAGNSGDTEGAEAGASGDTAGADACASGDTVMAEAAASLNTQGAEPAASGDTMGAEAGASGDTVMTEAGASWDTTMTEAGPSGDTTGGEAGAAGNTIGAQAGASGDGVGAGAGGTESTEAGGPGEPAEPEQFTEQFEIMRQWREELCDVSTYFLFTLWWAARLPKQPLGVAAAQPWPARNLWSEGTPDPCLPGFTLREVWEEVVGNEFQSGIVLDSAALATAIAYWEQWRARSAAALGAPAFDDDAQYQSLMGHVRAAQRSGEGLILHPDCILS